MLPLPQVASHILQHTSRAAAAAQNQATHAFKNALGLQSSGTQSASTSLGTWNGAGSSSWGSGHAGAGGGAKYHTGSRFYSGYTGPGRAITQANTSTAPDSGSNQPDDEDVSLKPVVVSGSSRRYRNRSQSFSPGSREGVERGKELGVFKAVQQHVRSRHAFAEPSRPEVIPESPPTERVRRNSTSSTASLPSSGEPLHDIPPSAPVPQPSLNAADVDPATPQTVLSPDAPKSKENSPTPHRSSSPNAHNAHLALDRLRDVRTRSTVRDWNQVMGDLVAVRTPGEPVTEILQAYNDMVGRNIVPNMDTYALLIDVLCERDFETQKIISTLQTRIHRRTLKGMADSPDAFTDEKRIQALRAENNFASAMSLFQAANTLSTARFTSRIFLNLLRSAAAHGTIEPAIRIFAQAEKNSDNKLSQLYYLYLISTYSTSGDIEGAKVVFDEYLRAARDNRIFWTSDKGFDAHVGTIRIWNHMIDAYFQVNDPASALSLLEKMLDSKAGPDFTPAEVPNPNLATFNCIIRGFIRNGDVATALIWFERLMQEDHRPADHNEPTSKPPAPDAHMWHNIVEALAAHGMVEDLNRILKDETSSWTQAGGYDIVELRTFASVQAIAYHANVKYLTEKKGALSLDKANEIMEFTLNHILGSDSRKWTPRLREMGGADALEPLAAVAIEYGNVDVAIRVVEGLLAVVDHRLPVHVDGTMVRADISVSPLTDRILIDALGSPRDLSLRDCLRLATAWHNRGLHISQNLAKALSRSYTSAKESNEAAQLQVQDWELLAMAVTRDEAAAGTAAAALARSLLSDMAERGFDLKELSKSNVESLLAVVASVETEQPVRELLTSLGPAYSSLLETLDEMLTPQKPETRVPQPAQNLTIDAFHSRWVDEHSQGQRSSVSPHQCFARVVEGKAKGLYPTPEVLAHLIEALGRAKAPREVYVLYDDAQTALSLLENNKEEQVKGWFTVENAMIIAHGHLGDGPRADLHRMRLLENGASPTADAYGAMIQAVRETTDDTARAVAYFEESQMRGVTPNLFLYNTVISKLAKARKADYAIELFQKMRAHMIRPSSVTYGALIAACCRVGDVQSAETLFDEMIQQPNFKPRIPPYNTMMQFFVQTKPNRAQFLHYYEEMKRARIQPSAHTYKLLIDAYGTIEPPDFNAMSMAFNQLVKKGLQVTGAHWASLINAYGCVGKDLDKALEVFESIANHSTTRTAPTQLPDAVAYEAIINVLVTHRRTDLIPVYLDRLSKSGIHMTAYIVNILIKGHASAGDIVRAREAFESLADPPTGVAAANNHAPHDASPPHYVNPQDPVYREPSTWEAMVRAELGCGNRDQAVALLDRLSMRGYPESIYKRISGIMLDDTVSPWPSTDSGYNSSPIHSP
ncbi:uncharacterized protein STEHIDRAFT_80833 [Stereum hirsutum FP-91666 SS1]|uniref:uncharacterized protein n=1 Tax=Stereum hirsutum (strain FP-91666) TaxID=721885 RepID=UPI000444953A|nr:uncharacterized protein STEHIDRAFT_80833 [Stereum hirsutum FP-91666 SS1]EIM85452.1 hypothetical protein STEHIDRAFT_80833 [Stereum hirsutum FP-91666 SS1]